jgi:hypothetical protein
VTAPGDPIRERILDELREMRRGRGPISMDRIAVAQWLVLDLGRGSVELCYTMLLEFRDQHGADPESDIRAFYDTAGYKHTDETLEQRLRAYAEEHFVDPRTALRRSDRGAERLSHIVRDSYIGLRPWGHLALIQNGPAAQFRLEVSVDSGMAWHRPFLSVNDIDIDRSVFDLHETIQDPSRVSAVYTHLPDPILRDPPPGKPLFWINIHWQMPVWPTWSISSVVADPRLYARMTVTRNNSLAVAIDWSPMQDFDQEAPFAFEPVVERPAFMIHDPRSDLTE